MDGPTVDTWNETSKSAPRQNLLNMISPQFPLEECVRSTIKLLDNIQYDDTNFTCQERLGHLQHVYAGVVKYFQQPRQIEFVAQP